MVQLLQESYGAGFAKNKEAQAAVKALDASLSAYSAGLTTYVIQHAQQQQPPTTANTTSGTVGFVENTNEIDAAEEESKTVEETKQVHSVVKALLESCPAPAILLIQRDLTDSEGGASAGIAGNAVRVADVSDEILRIKGDALGWCRLTDGHPGHKEDASAVEVSPMVEPSTEISRDSNSDQQQANQEAVDKPKPVDTSKLKGLQVMNDFLTNTVLPVLAGGMIQAIRNDVHDPIAFLADFLLAESAERQARCEEEARQNFEDLLSNC